MQLVKDDSRDRCLKSKLKVAVAASLKLLSLLVALLLTIALLLLLLGVLLRFTTLIAACSWLLGLRVLVLGGLFLLFSPGNLIIISSSPETPNA